MPEAAETTDVIIDIAKSANRAPKCEGSVPCLVPNSLPFRYIERRVLTPIECLALQGINKEDFCLLERWATNLVSLRVAFWEHGAQRSQSLLVSVQKLRMIISTCPTANVATLRQQTGVVRTCSKTWRVMPSQAPLAWLWPLLCWHMAPLSLRSELCHSGVMRNERACQVGCQQAMQQSLCVL